MRRALVAIPSLQTVGGGERTAAMIATALARAGYEAHLLIPPQADASLDRLQERFGIDLGSMPRHHLARGRARRWLRTSLTSRAYDVFVWQTPVLPPLCLSRNGILWEQMPMTDTTFAGSLHRALSRTYRHWVFNSEFTRDNSRGHGDHPNPVVINPGTFPGQRPDADRAPLVLAVGRFDVFPHDKHHGDIVRAFSLLAPKLLGWKLVLVGGTLRPERAAEVIAQYGRLASELGVGDRVEVLPNLPAPDLVELYRQAAFFWHLAGLNEADPRRREHFGKAVVEAMSNGCVPIVAAGGGPDQTAGRVDPRCLVNSIEDLVATTLEIAGSTAELTRLSIAAARIGNEYGDDRFADEIATLVDH